jgi:4a-hydroxytetrahydrobiopterin dehydratase
MELASKTCVPCRGGVPPLAAQDMERLRRQLDDGWEIVDGHHLKKELEFEDFAGALRYVNRVGEIAEAEGHHPDLYLTWGHVRVEIWTHKIDGLTESDFILAAKLDAIPVDRD